MIIVPSLFDGACWLEPTRIQDDRGFFARIYCKKEFAAAGLVSNFVQNSISFNAKKGTLRGLHFQAGNYQETKLVRCTSGSIFDVIVDLRRDSVSYGQWCFRVLSAENRTSAYIPEGFAHGFQCLENDCEVEYQISKEYVADAASGIRYDDPDLAIEWPLNVSIISPKDMALQSFAKFATYF
ncbi:MAG: dTDP-4-dehydrorhamnose 3,5-epimerase [Cyanobacteria bacterium DS3.002]|nr:dTDP-4-dehydrorhamnose 3,5-epimerase [Cyanobacteria bacterium DS3.002]MBA4049657.1 dTDP-4-dehydrorhamnose 3,5-epimerase [Cyanobacteria bacterium DS2.008]MBA4078022.1 dTDP-4-dehydrorhamnose 3,5-epimerase [Cyanobacteria bacterium PR.023]